MSPVALFVGIDVAKDPLFWGYRFDIKISTCQLCLHQRCDFDTSAFNTTR